MVQESINFETTEPADYKVGKTFVRNGLTYRTTRIQAALPSSQWASFPTIFAELVDKLITIKLKAHAYVDLKPRTVITMRGYGQLRVVEISDHTPEAHFIEVTCVKIPSSTPENGVSYTLTYTTTATRQITLSATSAEAAREKLDHLDVESIMANSELVDEDLTPTDIRVERDDQ